MLVAPEADSGKTALHLAAEAGYLETVVALLEAARTAGPLPLPATAAPAQEPHVNLTLLFQRGHRRLRSGDTGSSLVDSETGGRERHAPVWPRAGNGLAIREEGGSAADSQAGGEGLACASNTGAGNGGGGVAGGHVRSTGAEEDGRGASPVYAMQ